MEQVERLCSNICLINKGEIIVEGKLDEIRKSNQTNEVEVHFIGNLDSNTVGQYLSEFKIKENSISGLIKKNHREFLDWINKKVIVESFQLKVPTLEKIFIDEVSKIS